MERLKHVSELIRKEQKLNKTNKNKSKRQNVL
jgi:hypothetical protein